MSLFGFGKRLPDISQQQEAIRNYADRKSDEADEAISALNKLKDENALSRLPADLVLKVCRRLHEESFTKVSGYIEARFGGNHTSTDKKAISIFLKSQGDTPESVSRIEHISHEKVAFLRENPTSLDYTKVTEWITAKDIMMMSPSDLKALVKLLEGRKDAQNHLEALCNLPGFVDRRFQLATEGSRWLTFNLNERLTPIEQKYLSADQTFALVKALTKWRGGEKAILSLRGNIQKEEMVYIATMVIGDTTISNDFKTRFGASVYYENRATLTKDQTEWLLRELSNWAGGGWMDNQIETVLNEYQNRAEIFEIVTGMDYSFIEEHGIPVLYERREQGIMPAHAKSVIAYASTRDKSSDDCRNTRDYLEERLNQPEVKGFLWNIKPESDVIDYLKGVGDLNLVIEAMGNPLPPTKLSALVVQEAIRRGAEVTPAILTQLKAIAPSNGPLVAAYLKDLKDLTPLLELLAQDPSDKALLKLVLEEAAQRKLNIDPRISCAAARDPGSETVVKNWIKAVYPHLNQEMINHFYTGLRFETNPERSNMASLISKDVESKFAVIFNGKLEELQAAAEKPLKIENYFTKDQIEKLSEGQMESLVSELATKSEANAIKAIHSQNRALAERVMVKLAVEKAEPKGLLLGTLKEVTGKGYMQSILDNIYPLGVNAYDHIPNFLDRNSYLTYMRDTPFDKIPQNQRQNHLNTLRELCWDKTTGWGELTIGGALSGQKRSMGTEIGLRVVSAYIDSLNTSNDFTPPGILWIIDCIVSEYEPIQNRTLISLNNHFKNNSGSKEQFIQRLRLIAAPDDLIAQKAIGIVEGKR